MILRRSRPIIIVSGLPRSGTSLAMQLLQAGGIAVLTDGIRKPDDNNPRGYYEYERVKQLDQGDTGWMRKIQGHAIKIVSALLTHIPIGKLDYQIIFIERDLHEILRSQQAMLTHRAQHPPTFDEASMLTQYADHLKHVKSWLAEQPRCTTLYVQHRQLITAPQQPIEAINTFLGGQLNTTAMLQVIDPQLYRQRQ